MLVGFRKICWVGLLILLFLGCGRNVRASATQIGTAGRGVLVHAHTPISRSDFSKFAGTWFAHGALLIFYKDGQALFTERTYIWCASDVQPPCDSIDASGRIQPGYQEKIHFWRATGSIAYGTIVTSNIHSKGLPVTARLQANDTLLYVANRSIVLLCGPNSPSGTCGA